MSLTGPQAKFAAAYAVDMNGTRAYLSAYPKSSAKAAESSASALLRNPKVQAEIARIRQEADAMQGSAVLTLAEKQSAAAAILRAENGMWRGSEVRTSDRLKAIEVHNNLSGQGSESEANDALTALLGRVSK